MYIPHTQNEIELMLKEIGVKTITRAAYKAAYIVVRAKSLVFIFKFIFSLLPGFILVGGTGRRINSPANCP